MWRGNEVGTLSCLLSSPTEVSTVPGTTTHTGKKQRSRGERRRTQTMLGLSSQNKVPLVSHSHFNGLAGMGRLGLCSRATRIAKLTGQGSDGHLKSLQSSAGRTAWLSCHCQRLLLWICQQYRGRRRPVLRWDGYQTPCLTSSVAQAWHWRFLGEDHPPERPDHRPGGWLSQCLW